MRTFDVLVEQTINGWVTVEAEDEDAANRLILRKALVIPNQAERRYARQTLPRDPATRYGRVLVHSASRTCGPDPKMLLRLDCGHYTYVDTDLWYPDNPYAECTNTRCVTH